MPEKKASAPEKPLPEGPAMPPQPPKPEVLEYASIPPEGITETRETDVLVLGGGHAGLHCALAAAERGADVLVLESRPEAGLNWMGEQVGTFNSLYAIRQGLGPYDLDEIVEECCKNATYSANRALIARYVKKSGEMLDHVLSLIPEGSTILDPDQLNFQRAYGEQVYPRINGGYKTWAGTLQFRGSKRDPAGDEPMDRTKFFSRLGEVELYCMQESRRLGAEWIFEQKAVCLIREDGRVIGAVARDREGGFHRYLAKKGVVVATGSAMGNGVAMAEAVGGLKEQPIHFHHQLMNTGMIYGFWPALMLNAHGRRFCNEGIPQEIPLALNYQPSGKVCCVYDAKYMKMMESLGLQHGNPDFGRPDYIEEFLADMPHVVEHGAEGYSPRDLSFSGRGRPTRIYGANSLEELADYLGYEGADRETFLSEIERYNEMCRAGKDTDFQKPAESLFSIDEPPYYASFVTKRTLDYDRLGPNTPPVALITDADMNVLDSDCEPIPGLYAAGDNLGGRFGLFYMMVCGGYFIGTAMTLGRELGRQLAGS